MTLEEARAKRAELNHALKSLIFTFEMETGLCISGMSMKRSIVRTLQGRREDLVAIETTVEML